MSPDVAFPRLNLASFYCGVGGAIFALLAIAPFAIALFVGGPVSGILLQRFGPRGVMAFGTGILGLADIALAATFIYIGDSPSYLAFILPLVLIGALIVLIIARIDPRILSREEAEEFFGLPVVAEIPAIAPTPAVIITSTWSTSPRRWARSSWTWSAATPT